jgi:hypothetical protein
VGPRAGVDDIHVTKLTKSIEDGPSSGYNSRSTNRPLSYLYLVKNIARFMPTHLCTQCLRVLTIQ